MENAKRKPRSTKAKAKAHITRQQAAKGKAARDVNAAKKRTKTALLIDLLTNPLGCTVAEMQEAVGWQAHSVHGFMAGTLKKKGLHVRSEGVGSERRYYLLDSSERP